MYGLLKQYSDRAIPFSILYPMDLWSGESGVGSREWGMGNGEWGVGSGEWGMGNGSGEWGVGNGISRTVDWAGKMPTPQEKGQKT
jgi:hypothetical protein